MKVLVVYASRYGATQRIAERIADLLRQQGLEVPVQQADSADRAEGYDAVVIGSAAYYFRWMKEAKAYVQRNRNALFGRPVWLFSSGPLGNARTDPQGRDVREATIPMEIGEILETVHPVEHHVFFGALDYGKLGFFHRLLTKMPFNKGGALFPQGDFRDWAEIEGWATSIGRTLTSLHTDALQ